jgi:hypothetical protein
MAKPQREGPPSSSREASTRTAHTDRSNQHITTSSSITPAQDRALAVARSFIDAGIPVFLARPALDADGEWDPSGGSGGSGYVLPPRWQQSKADPAVLDQYRPGDALGAVMGHTLDVLDVDSHKGGDASKLDLQIEGVWPGVLGVQRTPSGGTHDFINPLRVGSRDGFATGIDHKGGRDDGSGRGFVWIGPTLKLSKVTGELAEYRWEQPPALDRIDPADTSGAVIAALIRGKRGPEATEQAEARAEAYDAMTPERRAQVDRYISSAIAGVTDELTFSDSMAPGARDERGRGWEKKQADAALRLASFAVAGWNALTLEEARDAFANAAPTDAGWTSADVQEKFTAQSRRAKPAVMPDFKEQAAAEPGADPFAEAVRAKAREIQIYEAAQRLVRANRAGVQTRPAVETLSDFLETPDEQVRYRVDQLWPMGGRGILAAAYKSGKSTMVANAIRSLVDGDLFLGTYTVEQSREVVLIDNELDPRTLRAWLRDQNIRNTERVKVVSLRGKTSTFDILDPETRATWAKAIQGGEVVILDCLRPVLDALGLDENRDAGRFLVAFDSLLDDAGAGEALVIHHMGHAGERSRGDSRLQDWPDVTWKLLREDPDNPGSATYFSAFGRDVNVQESQVKFDPFSRHLTLVGGTRKDARVDSKVAEVVAFVTANPGSSKTVIRREVDGDSTAIGKAVEKALQAGLITEQPRQGRGGGHVYFES